MGYFKANLICPIVAAWCVAGCAHTHRIPKILPVSSDYYPRSLMTHGIEGRVLVEFRLDERRRPIQWTVTAHQAEQLMFGELNNSTAPLPDMRPLLNQGALTVIVGGGMKFDPADKTKPDPKHRYLVTVVFCLEPANCDRIPPFPDTAVVLVETRPVRTETLTP